MSDISVSRRGFLKGGGLLVGTLAFASGPIAMLAPTRTWALETTNLSEHQSRVIIAFSQVLYPHKGLEEAVYALVAKALDQDAAKNPATAAILANGVARLDEIAGGNWLKRNSAMRLIDVESMEGSDFFEKVRGTAVVALYNNDMSFAHFDYGGSVWNQGGYLGHGFNDLHWLPAPPDSASGPIPGAKPSRT